MVATMFAAKGRADLVQDVVVFLAGAEVCVVANLEGCAVGGEAAAQVGGDAGRKVAAHAGGTVEHHFGLTFADDAVDDAEMGQGAVGRQARIVGIKDGVDTIGIQLLFEVGKVVASHYGFKLTTQAVGQAAAFGAELEADVGNAAGFVDFNIYEYAVHDLSNDVVGNKI